MSKNNWLNNKFDFTHTKTRWLVLVLFACLLPSILSLFSVDFSSSATQSSSTLVTGAIHHALLEWAGVSIAIIASLVSFLHYARFRDITVPIVGCAIMCAGFIDAFHTLAATRVITASADNNGFIPFTWAISRIFNATIMIVGVVINLWLYQKYKVHNTRNSTSSDSTDKKDNPPSVKTLLVIACAFLLFSYLTINAVANSIELPVTMYPDAQIKRPFDVLPLGLFIFAGTLYWLWYRQDGQKSQLRFVLVMSIVLEVATQLHMAFGSTALYDHHFNIAHMLKIIAYGAVLVGLLVDLINNSDANKVDAQQSSVDQRSWLEQQHHKGVLETGVAKRPIGVQLPLLAFIMATSVAFVVSFSFYFESERILRNQEVEDLGVESNLVKPLLTQLYQQSSSDLLIISNTPEIKHIIDAVEQNNQQQLSGALNELQQMFSLLLDNKQDYLKVSLIKQQVDLPTASQEIASTERTIGGIVQVPNAQLTDGIHHQQLMQAASMTPKSVYFSTVTLRKKNNQILTPHQPVIEVLTPIYNPDNNQLFGVISLEVNFLQFVERLKSSYLSGLNLYIANAQGDFIYHPQKRFMFGFELAQQHLIQEQFPDLKKALEQSTDYQGFKRLVSSNGQVKTGFYRLIDLSKYGSNKHLRLLLTPNNSDGSDELQTFRYRSLLIGISLAFIALAITVVASRRVVQPLTEMTIAVQNYEQTGRLPKLPIKSNDEFGVLARSFHNLLFRVTNALEMQKRSATRLQDTSDKLEAILSSAADAIVTIDGHADILTFNTAAENIFGYSQEQVIGQNVKILMPKEFANNHDEMVKHYINSNKGNVVGVGRELVGLRSNGELFPMHLAISEINSSTGKIITGIIRDISVQKQDEAAIKRNLSLLQSILESTDNGILVTDDFGCPIHHNSQFKQMWCISDKLVDSSNAKQLQTHMIAQLNDPSLYITKTDQLLNDHDSESNEVFTFKDGRLIERTSRPMLVAHETDGRVWSYRDITLAKQTEFALIEAKNTAENIARYKSEFLASMSHEIRTPMNGVLGMLGLLQHSNLNDNQAHHAQLARSSAESLLTIINDILDFSKVEAGKLDLEIIEYNLSSQLGDFAESIAHRAQEKQLELILDVTQIKNTTVKGDPGRLRQILNNLVGNALKFTHQGEITITAKLCEVQDHKMRLDCTVKDTGIGIEHHKLELLFESFTQVDASTTREYGGTGLGLAIVKQLCHLMKGDVWVSSVPGQGSEFGFYILLDKSEHSTELMPKVNISGIPILIVDDNDTNLQVLSSQLKNWGAQVTQANSANQALGILDQRSRLPHSEPFAVAFIDMQMPKMNGLELGKAIRSDARFDKTQMVMMTSMSNRGDAKRFADVGFCAYFPKPTTTSDLFDSLAIVIAGGEPLKHASPLITRHYIKELKQQHQVIDDNQTTQEPLKEFAPDTRLLLVEDNFINQTVAVAQIQQIGLNCDVAANGLEALELLQAAPQDAPYDLIFMDCQMPELDGYEATQKIRSGHAGSRYQQTPIVAMTANAMEGDREKCLLAGMSDYISKPISPDIVEQKLRYWLLEQ